MKKVLVLLSITICFSAFGKVILPGIFSSNMVLQQQSSVAIWGSSDKDASITITTSWNGEKYTVHTGKNKEWKTKIVTPAAGGPFQITINDGEKAVLENVLIGEVWFCSGQSNMEMALRGNSSPILNSNEIILHADNPQLRLYTIDRAASLSPVKAYKNKWKESNSENARDYSALAFQYGQILQEKLKVPVGLILSSVGGTMIESWMSAESLKPFPQINIPGSIDTFSSPHKAPTSLFNGMVAPLTDFSIKGFIWYQGESNRQEGALYEKLFPAMVADWRKKWNLGDIPFYYVQIAPFGSSDSTRSGPRLREAQLKDMQLIPNAGMASAMDVGMENDIHFMDKTKLAQRLAYWALGNTYGIKGIGFKAPVFKAMKTEGSKTILIFENAPYLTSYRKPLKQFEVAGADRHFYPATATINKNEVMVQSEQVKQPVAVRYAYKEWVVGELYNNDNIPASSFRTDDW